MFTDNSFASRYTSKFIQPFSMPSSNVDILFSLRSSRMSFDNPWNSVVENIGFSVSPNRLPANLRSSTEFCTLLNDFSDSLRMEFCDKSSFTENTTEINCHLKQFVMVGLRTLAKFSMYVNPSRIQILICFQRGHEVIDKKKFYRTPLRVRYIIYYSPVDGNSCMGTEWWPAFLWVNTKTGASFGKFTWSLG